jgi:hypothetical protein
MFRRSIISNTALRNCNPTCNISVLDDGLTSLKSQTLYGTFSFVITVKKSQRFERNFFHLQVITTSVVTTRGFFNCADDGKSPQSVYDLSEILRNPLFFVSSLMDVISDVPRRVCIVITYQFVSFRRIVHITYTGHIFVLASCRVCWCPSPSTPFFCWLFVLLTGATGHR